MIETEQQEITFSLVGGDLSLDFTNTVGGRRDLHGLERDKLVSYERLVSWSRQAGILTPPEADRLLSQAKRHPQQASEALESAIALREAIYRIFAATASGSAPAAADLEAFNAALSEAMSRSRIVYKDGSYSWGWARDEDELDRMLWPIARSAAELLTSGELRRVRQCAGESCGWLFVDASRNRSRRWCDMSDCGNRAKVKRFYRRQRSAAASESNS